MKQNVIWRLTFIILAILLLSIVILWVIGVGTAQSAFQDSAQLDEFSTAWRNAFLLTGAIAFLLVTGLGAFFARTYQRKLASLNREVQELLDGSMANRVSTAVKDEFDELGSALAELGDELEVLRREASEAREMHAAILGGMREGVIIVNGDGEIVLINPEAERLFERRNERSVGLSLVQAVRHHEIVDVWRQCQKENASQAIYLDFVQQEKYVLISASPLSGVLAGHTLLIFRDQTRLRHLETVRKDFVSNISHELRTPLASLKALAETLQAGALEDPGAARRFLDRIDTEVDALGQMVTELLELSRIESGQVPLERIAAPPCTILREASERLRIQAERARVELKLECPDGLPMVYADPPRLLQVFVNLIHNAIKFTEVGGAILVSAEQKDGAVLFSVRDNGVGIADDNLPRIFERFFKGDRARSGGGTGLGLAISKHLVEAHGGKIWAESVEGSGSTFSLTIPSFSGPAGN